MAMRVTREINDAGAWNADAGGLHLFAAEPGRPALEHGTSKLFVFVGGMQVDIDSLAEMAGQTLGLQRLVPITTGSAGRRVSPYTFLQMLQSGDFAVVYEREGHLYGIVAEELEKKLNGGASLYATVDRIVADQLSSRYGERVCRIFAGLERARLIARCESEGMEEAAIADMVRKDDLLREYKETCELSYALQNDEAYTLFAMTQALEPMLERGLVEYD